ncbi:MAG: DUF1598 domain-containing protein [Planctomycetia bacterium]|jgi:hypothetical protein
MRWQTVALNLVVLAILIGIPSTVLAQGMAPAGVMVDAKGVLHKQIVNDPGGMLMKERAAAARASLDPDVIKFSKLRKISLNRLAAELEKRQGILTDEMRYLAGLQRARYVFYYPETKDIVLAGPAEGWMTDPTGRVIGMKSGRPVLQLQDLVVALRAFPPEGDETKLIGCSIDPTQKGLAAMQQFLAGVGAHASPAQTEYIVTGLQNSLGHQNVTVKGVPPKTHFAQVLVEADYRMKLIGIGLEQPPVRLVSFVDRVRPSEVARNAMQRWFFVPDYNCVRVDEDGLAMELVGDGVKLIGEDEAVLSDGRRTKAATGNQASAAFVRSFTKRYSELADRSPIFAELRNLIDLSVVAAYMQREGLYEKAGWTLGILGDEKKLPVETYNAPEKVMSAVAARWKGRQLMTPVGGGVKIEPTMALQSENLVADPKGQTAAEHGKVKLTIPKDRWWWD